MWRDRTNLYISYRQSYSHHPSKRARFTDSHSVFASDDDRRGLLSSVDDDDASHNGDAVIEMDLLPPRWADVSDEVNELLQGIARKSTLLERLHNKHVLPGFDDSRSEEGEIERLTNEITGDFHKCQAKIQRVGSMVKAADCSKAEEAMGRNIQISLATRVQESSTQFRKKQSAYLKKLRGISGMSTPLDRAGSPSPYNTDTDPSADVSFSQSALQQSATLTSNDAAIMQREREITDIAKGIIELAEIFKELQTMVIDQGTMLDRIDFNVEMLNVHVKEADKEMNIASGYQRKTTKRKIMFLLFLIILGLIILLVIKPKGSTAPPPKKPPTRRAKIRGREVVW
ncbi:t-SNARE [Wilcoxina mikolae CBS 423.85]|nr:t-SNARE [Wilcoxina mikolae CBS 423.85]